MGWILYAHTGIHLTVHGKLKVCPLVMILLFSVKATANSSDVIHQAKCDVSDRLINVNIPAATFAEIPVGSYVYDLVLRSEGHVTTLLFPANLHIKAVVHSE